MTSPVVDPPTFTMSVTETLALPFDAADYLSAGQSIAAVTATLTNLRTNVATTVGGTSSVNGTVITQPIDGPTELVAPGEFLLTINFNASPSVNIWAMELTIVATV